MMILTHPPPAHTHPHTHLTDHPARPIPSHHCPHPLSPPHTRTANERCSSSLGGLEWCVRRGADSSISRRQGRDFSRTVLRDVLRLSRLAHGLDEDQPPHCKDEEESPQSHRCVSFSLGLLCQRHSQHNKQHAPRRSHPRDDVISLSELSIPSSTHQEQHSKPPPNPTL